MPPMQKHRRPGFLALCAAALITASLAACAGNPVKEAAQAAGIGGEPKPAPDFVTRSRASSYEYMPVGEAAPKRRLRAKDSAGVEDAEKSMDSLRARNEARGRSAKSAADAAQAAQPAPAQAPAAQ